MRNIFLEKSYKRCVRETSHRLLSKTTKLRINRSSGSTVWTFMEFVFIVFPIRRLPKQIEIKVLSICFYLIKSFSNNIKSKPQACISASLSQKSLEKSIFRITVLRYSPISIYLSVYLSIYLSIYLSNLT